MIQKMLQESGYKVGLMTTISIDYGDGPSQTHTPNNNWSNELVF